MSENKKREVDYEQLYHETDAKLNDYLSKIDLLEDKTKLLIKEKHSYQNIVKILERQVEVERAISWYE